MYSLDLLTTLSFLLLDNEPGMIGSETELTDLKGLQVPNPDENIDLKIETLTEADLTAAMNANVCRLQFLIHTSKSCAKRQ